MDQEKLEKSKNNLLKQMEEKKQIKKLKKKTKEESAFSDKFGKNKKAGVGSLPGTSDIKTIESGGGQKIFIMTDEKQKFSKGGRAMLRGGGICKKGMNKKAIGANS
tara:strand:+ start:176 stop:493 length:318 start_codon:yes stop_codon:yes gene_type:complete